MKKNILFQILFIAFFTLLISIYGASLSYATTEACSGHEGVNCSAGADEDGSVICNDGWLESSVDYTDTHEECGDDYVELESTQTEEVQAEETVIDTSETNMDESESMEETQTESEMSEETSTEETSGDDETKEDAMLTETVDEDNLIEVFLESIEGLNEEEMSQIIEQAVEDILQESENMTDEEVRDLISNIQEKITERGGSGRKIIRENPNLRAEETIRVRALNLLLARLRAKLIAAHPNLTEAVRRGKESGRIYAIRWGNLEGLRACAGVDRRAIIQAVEDRKNPCASDPIEYFGSISVDSGTIEVKKEILFEDTDKVVNSGGSEITFESTIDGHWDGLFILYTPDESKDSPANITIHLGDLNETFTGSQALGRKRIGNGQMIEIRQLSQLLQGLSNENRSRILNSKLDIENRVNSLRNRILLLRYLNESGVEIDGLEALLDQIEEYNFDDASADEIKDAIGTALANFKDDLTEDDIAAIRQALATRVDSIKAKAKLRKFNSHMIPFKDTDDNEWYTGFVSSIQSLGIISGYKDANGNSLGEYRPGNYITIAEILKIALETSQNGGSNNGTPALRAAINHWAKAYVKRAEELNLDIVGDSSTDLNRPATRAEVVRLFLEALGIVPDSITDTSFSDLDQDHKHAAYVEYAKKLGIISGDDNASTFRPDAPINRAEAAKIANQIIEIIMGGVNQE